VTLRRHRAGVRALAFTPDGQTLATGGFDHAISIWDVPTGRELRTMTDHTGPVQSLAFSPDGRSLASVSQDRTVRIWNPLTNQSRLTLPGKTLPDPRGVMFRSDNLGVVVVSAEPGRNPAVEIRRHLAGPEPAILPDALAPFLLCAGTNTLAVAVESRSDGDLRTVQYTPGSIRLWDTTTGQAREVLSGHSYMILAMSASRDGKVLVSVANPGDVIGQPRPGEVKVWDVVRGQELVPLPPLPGLVRAVALQPGGTLLAVATVRRESKPGQFNPAVVSSTIQLFEITTGQEVHKLAGHQVDVKDVKFSADGKSLGAVSVNIDGDVGGLQPRLQSRDVTTGKELTSFSLGVKQVDSPIFTDEGRLLLAHADSRARIWDVATGDEKPRLTGDPVPARSIACSPDGKTAVTANYPDAYLWNIQSLKLREEFNSPPTWIAGGRVLRWSKFLTDQDNGNLITDSLTGSVEVSTDRRVLAFQRNPTTNALVHLAEPGSKTAPRHSRSRQIL
jgi:WD40 repeat protein